jgi:transcriptional regulator with XRE-family HTH domain
MVSRLRDARLACGLTQDQLAEKLGKTQSFIAKYETRERSLEFFEVLELCQVLKITVSHLVSEARQAVICGSVKGVSQ